MKLQRIEPILFLIEFDRNGVFSLMVVVSPILLFLWRVFFSSCAFNVTFCSYIIEGGVCYLTMCDRSYPKKLAFQYLEDLQREFEKVNRSQIETVARPYAFIKFGIDLASLTHYLGCESFHPYMQQLYIV